ncbi:hypothetical protein H0E87_015762 [Populus deltoides]|uniref:Uncharacterized protein n=1 Tax=Populus deltoides TaxID=3696 RepID=A0A8T2Y6G3_POPDE|nr:hypothetical protein H0E87_015762 [Populus deltoides]
MLLEMSFFNSFMLLSLLLFVVAPVHGLNLRKLDETAVPGPTEEKCSPCNPSPPPPSLPPVVYPSPPPPSPPPPSPVLYPPPPPAPVLPPPTPKKPPSGYNCPPPPAPSNYDLYITGPPGELYPVDKDVNAASRHAVSLQVLIGCGLIGLLVRIGF